MFNLLFRGGNAPSGGDNENLATGDDNLQNASEPLMEGLANSLSGIVAGTIHEAEAERMKKLLFRVTRGMAVTYFEPFI